LGELIRDLTSQRALSISGKSPIQISAIGQVPNIVQVANDIDHRNAYGGAFSGLGNAFSDALTQNFNAIDFVSVDSSQEQDCGSRLRCVFYKYRNFYGRSIV
jgi:hypothetical protein